MMGYGQNKFFYMVGATLHYKTMNKTKKKTRNTQTLFLYGNRKQRAKVKIEVEMKKMGNACQQMHINLPSISIVRICLIYWLEF